MFDNFFHRETHRPGEGSHGDQIKGPVVVGNGGYDSSEKVDNTDSGFEKESEEADFHFETPNEQSYSSISFIPEHYDGLEMRPGQVAVFDVPKEFRGRIVRDIILKHRKAEAYRNGVLRGEHDSVGSYSNLEVHDHNSDTWYGWMDPKGYDPIKYAEHRPASDPEVEVLHDWVATVGRINADKVRLESVGKNPDLSVVNFHGLEIIFFPEIENTDFVETIYTDGTSFIDLEKGELLPKYGGGSHTEGVYKGAMALGSSHAWYELGGDPGEGVEVSGSSMRIGLEPGRSLIGFEIAVGDTEHLNYVSQKTGRKTRLGWAKLWIGVERVGGGTEWVVQNANVPPQGVIAGSLSSESAEVVDGDMLVIESRYDTSYVMGWRLSYSKGQDHDFHTSEEAKGLE